MGLFLLTAVACGAEGDEVSAGSGTTGDGPVAGPARTQSPEAEGTGVRGRVTGTAGVPVELATITVTGGPRTDGPVSQQANVTDAQGRYFFPLPPGQWEITVTAHRYDPVTRTLVVSEGEPTTHHVVLEAADR